MSVTLNEIIGHPPLQLRLLAARDDAVEVNWAHSSDLDDPAPFLEPGQLLLTTGRQFTSFEHSGDYDDYVRRIASAGVVALGFGTEVVRSGTPSDLIGACEQQGIALVEVPYATPFIAVSKFIADSVAAEARRQVVWTVEVQDSISKAVLGSGGLEAAVWTASRALECSIAVLDPDGGVLEGAGPDWLVLRALDLLRRGRRARDQGEDHRGSWIAQTLGRSGRLLGSLVVFRAKTYSSADVSVLTMLAALTELALEHAEDQRLAFRSVGVQLFGLLRNGRVDVVCEALAHYPVQLPVEPFRVVAVQSEDLAPDVRDSIERMAAHQRYRLFAVAQGDQFLVLVDESSIADVTTRLSAARIRAGVSNDVGWTELKDAISQSTVSLSRAQERQMLEFHELMDATIFGLLNETQVAEVAGLRLARILSSDDGRQLLRAAAVWLEHNASWEPSARALNLHRHTLKQRISEVAQRLRLPLDTFQGRAELWAMLVAIDLTATSTTTSNGGASHFRD